MTKDQFEQMVATLREEYVLEPEDLTDIEEFIGYARRGFELRPFVLGGEINEEDWRNILPGAVILESTEADAIPVPRLMLLSMGTDHVITGSPGPLFGAGWASACKHWSKKLLAMTDTGSGPKKECE